MASLSISNVIIKVLNGISMLLCPTQLSMGRANEPKRRDRLNNCGDMSCEINKSAQWSIMSFAFMFD